MNGTVHGEKGEERPVFTRVPRGIAKEVDSRAAKLYDSKWISCRRYWEADDAFALRAAPETRPGLSATYNEIPIPLNSSRLALRSALVYQKEPLR